MMRTICSWRPEKKFPRPKKKKFEDFASFAVEASGCGLKDALGVMFVSAEEMAELNRRLVGHDGLTDVITFDYRESGAFGFGGEDADTTAIEIFIAPEAAERECGKHGNSYPEELALYLVHGLLHCSGYNDLTGALKRRMRRAEKRTMKLLGERFSFEDVFPLPEVRESAVFRVPEEKKNIL